MLHIIKCIFDFYLPVFNGKIFERLMKKTVIFAILFVHDPNFLIPLALTLTSTTGNGDCNHSTTGLEHMCMQYQWGRPVRMISFIEVY